MSKVFKNSVIFLSGLFLLTGISILASPKVSAAASCYSRTNQTNETVKIGICDYNGLRDSGFAMGSLPNPLDPSKCYFWAADAAAVGRVVNCSLPEYANAKPMGGNVPPPVSLDSAIQNNNLAQANIDRPDPCDGSGSSQKLRECLEKNPIVVIIQWVINFLSIGVGVVVVIMIIIGGIQYASAGGNPSGVSEGKKKITNAILALLAYIFLYAALQWLVPGGIF